MTSTPSGLVLNRLEHVLESHESSLAGLTLRRTNNGTATTPDTSSNGPVVRPSSKPAETTKSNNDRGTNRIVEAALRRIYCSQPPLDSTRLGGGSWNAVADLTLNPPERVAPHKLVLSSSAYMHHDQAQYNATETPNATTPILSRDDIESVVASSTFKAITAISTLCDEIHELETVAISRFMPQLTLFAHDLRIPTVQRTKQRGFWVSSSSTATTKAALAAAAATVMDEGVVAQRDSELLRRIGWFVPTLQTVMNLVLRCQRLLRNLVAQLDGCYRPISSWGLSSPCFSGGGNGGNGSDGGDENAGVENGDTNTSNRTNSKDVSSRSTDSKNDPSLFQRSYQPNSNARSSSATNNNETTHCVPLLPVGDAIAKLLGILISIDNVVAHNEELQEAWDLYKSVVKDKSDHLQKLEMRLVNREQSLVRVQQKGSQQGTEPRSVTVLRDGGVDDNGATTVVDKGDGGTGCTKKEQGGESLTLQEQRKKMMLLERMMLQIDFTLLSSRCYITAIEQNFDPHGTFFNSTYYWSDTTNSRNNEPSAMIGSTTATGGGYQSPSSAFAQHEEIKTFITTMLRKCTTLVHTKHETTERKDLIGIYGMYGLYRRLLPSHLSPDENLHKSLAVDLPSICPVLPLVGTTDVPFIPLQFLSRYASLARVGGGGVNNNGSGSKSNFNPGEAMKDAREVMEKKDFIGSVNKLHADATLWLLSAESDLAPSTLSSLSSRQTQGGEGEIRDADEDDNDNLYSSPLGGSSDVNDTLLSYTNTGGGRRQHTPTSIVEFKAVVILRGIRIARCSILMLKDFLHMHKSLDVPIRPEHFAPIEKLCSIIKSIEKTLRGRRRSSVVSFQQAALKLVASSIFKRFDTLRSYIDQHSASINRVHTLSEKVKLARLGASLSTLESLLKGSATFSPARRFAIEIAICACADGRDDEDFNTKVMDVSNNLVHNLRLITDLDDNMKEAFDCSFLYFYKGILPSLLKHIYESSMKLESPRLQLILSAFSDPCQLLSSKYMESENEMKPTLYQELYSSFVIEDSLRSVLLTPICECIENNLRLHVYAKNIEELKPPNPRTEENKQNVLWFLEMPLLYVCGISIDIKGYVQRQLESSFYNFSTVGLQDSQSYVEMSQLAKDIYGLDLVDNCLPAGRVDQGTDLAAIAKDMKSFTSTYNYNINQQNFIERRPKDGCKHLNTIGIESVSFSLKRHGMGIAATTSHMAYQFISKTFQSFSQLLVNDYFRSTLSKERRWFEQQENVQLVPYPIERAISLSKDIVNLGMTEEGISFLEYCKNLVTSLGNALGLIRLVSTGKLHAKNSVMQYLTTVRRFHSRCDVVTTAQQHMNEKKKKSDNKNHVERLRLILNTEISGGGSFLQSVLKVFKDVISESDHSHLDCVFLLFPALCLCWLESSLKGKAMVNKTFRTDDAFYTDDGFAMGAAFLLSILEQHDKLEALNWFDTFRTKYILERNDVRLRITEEEGTLHSTESIKQKSIPFLSFELQQNSKPKEENKGAINSELTRLKVIAKRLELRIQEMEMLYYSIEGACIFFRATK